MTSLLFAYFACFVVSPAPAGERSGTVQSTRLYTAPDPHAAGGITGTISGSAAPALGVYAMPQHDERKVYRATLSESGTRFRFAGLPVAKYDLLILFADRFEEGFTLTRDADTLTATDRDLIGQAISRAVPFFDTKRIERCAGQTGRGETARCVLQELRTNKILAQSAEELKGYQIRSLKRVRLQDVGTIGWQLVETREIVRTEVAPGDPRGLLAHRHRDALQGIRVTDTIRDLGLLNLDRPAGSPAD